jgi:phosphate starvation-inducible membrane PsiE
MKFSDLCTPAALYLVLSAISIVIIIFTRFRFVSILIKILFVLAWTWILNFLCKKGYSTISWILVILPYLVMFGVIAMIFEFLKSGYSPHSSMMLPTMPNQGNQIPTYNNSLPSYVG